MFVCLVRAYCGWGQRNEDILSDLGTSPRPHSPTTANSEAKEKDKADHYHEDQTDDYYSTAAGFLPPSLAFFVLL